MADAEGKRFTVLNFHKGEKPKGSKEVDPPR
eukprot:COSAG05_NODE_26621_length_185_cov_148.848837_1_plen_30_part_01